MYPLLSESSLLNSALISLSPCNKICLVITPGHHTSHICIARKKTKLSEKSTEEFDQIIFETLTEMKNNHIFAFRNEHLKQSRNFVLQLFLSFLYNCIECTLHCSLINESTHYDNERKQQIFNTNSVLWFLVREYWVSGNVRQLCCWTLIGAESVISPLIGQ